MEVANQLIAQYGYYIVFINLALGLLGIPIPDEILLLTVGYFTKFGTLNYLYSIIICFIGTFIGMLISFLIGRKSSQPFIKRAARQFKVPEKSLNRAKNFMRKYGPFSILIGCFIPGVRQIISYFCGLSKMKLSVYIMFAGTGAITWCCLFLTLGRMIGHFN